MQQNSSYLIFLLNNIHHLCKENCLIILYLLSILGYWYTPVYAHQLDESYLHLEINGQSIQGNVSLGFKDLKNWIDLDRDQDKRLNSTELNSGLDKAQDFVQGHLMIQADGFVLPFQFTEHRIDDQGIDQYVVLGFRTPPCEKRIRSVEIDYRFFFSKKPSHRGILTFVYKNKTLTSVFRPQQQKQRFVLEFMYTKYILTQFIQLGQDHIWMGIDHILFLMALLLSSVLRCVGRKWEAVNNFKTALIQAVKLVTVFTVAHSVTLGLATFEIIRLPSRLVESVIAASIVFAGLNNLFPLVQQRSWLFVFIFGLFHGLGFAIILNNLKIPQGTEFLSLLGFNLGVEIGQLAIVILVFPLLYIFSRYPFYINTIFRPASFGITFTAILWFIQRAIL